MQANLWCWKVFCVTVKAEINVIFHSFDSYPSQIVLCNGDKSPSCQEPHSADGLSHKTQLGSVYPSTGLSDETVHQTFNRKSSQSVDGPGINSPTCGLLLFSAWFCDISLWRLARAFNLIVKDVHSKFIRGLFFQQHQMLPRRKIGSDRAASGLTCSLVELCVVDVAMQLFFCSLVICRLCPCAVSRLFRCSLVYLPACMYRCFPYHLHCLQ